MLIKVQQQISSTCTKNQLHCDNTINKEYLVSDATIRLSKEDVNCLFVFSKKKKIANCHCFLFVSFTQDDKENTVKKNHLQAPTNTLNNTFLNFV